MVETQHIFDGLYHPQPLVVVVSGPSGVGKDAVLQVLRRRGTDFHIVVTATSRAKRDTETEGVDYFFVTKQRFEEMIAQDELIEYAMVYDDYKGIPREQIHQALASGKDVILRLDVQGAAKVRSICPESVLIFLTPKNEEEWLQRLMGRASESPDSLKRRIETARQEVTRINEFDYVVINSQGELDATVDTILDIITAEHHRVVHKKVSL
jgi:guanylate kinase